MKETAQPVGYVQACNEKAGDTYRYVSVDVLLSSGARQT